MEMPEKFIWFDGLKFTLDEKTGYYLNSTIRKRLHRYVWEYHWGEIPKGYQIHHIDGDKSNNDISNLLMVSHHGHAVYHGNKRVETEGKAPFIERMDHARQFACEWHKSEAGSEWHKHHYEAMKEKLHARHDATCDYCGKPFAAYGGHNRFCSNACKSAWRRKQGIDNITRTCVICGKPFTTSKYSKAKCCSRECGSISCSRTKTNR
jgi:hypothetical protein